MEPIVVVLLGVDPGWLCLTDMPLEAQHLLEELGEHIAAASWQRGLTVCADQPSWQFACNLDLEFGQTVPSTRTVAVPAMPRLGELDQKLYSLARSSSPPGVVFFCLVPGRYSNKLRELELDGAEGCCQALVWDPRGRTLQPFDFHVEA